MQLHTRKQTAATQANACRARESPWRRQPRAAPARCRCVAVRRAGAARVAAAAAHLMERRGIMSRPITTLVQKCFMRSDSEGVSRPPGGEKAQHL